VHNVALPEQARAQPIHHHAVSIVVFAPSVEGRDQLGQVFLPHTILLQQQLQKLRQLRRQTQYPFDLNELLAFSHGDIIDNYF